MKVLPTFLIAGACMAPLSADPAPLSEPERQALIEKLDGFRNDAKSRVDSRYKVAEAAFRAGMASDEAAIELYTKCVEKVDFLDKERDSKAFRDWKKRNKDRLGSDSFALALRHQLRWLVFSLHAASDKGPKDLAPQAMDEIASIFSTAATLRPERQMLEENVAQTVFGRAYELQDLSVEGWPASPLPVGPVFEQVLLPPVRKAEKTKELREMWVARIRYEGLVQQHMRGGERDEKDPLPANYVRFLKETQPELIWKMEEDVFRAGDQRGAALRMIEHLENNLTHDNARDWEARFRNLVDPPMGGMTTDDEPG